MGGVNFFTRLLWAPIFDKGGQAKEVISFYWPRSNFYYADAMMPCRAMLFGQGRSPMIDFSTIPHMIGATVRRHFIFFPAVYAICAYAAYNISYSIAHNVRRRKVRLLRQSARQQKYILSLSNGKTKPPTKLIKYQ